MLVAFDPGGTTGWATFDLDADPHYRSGQMPDRQVWAYLDSVRSFTGKHPQVVIVETFRARRLGVDLSPVKVIAVIEEWARQHHVPVVGQRPDQGKFFWADDKVKDLGLWLPGKAHANDATRHLLYYIYFSGKVHLSDRGQPPTGLDRLPADGFPTTNRWR